MLKTQTLINDFEKNLNQQALSENTILNYVSNIENFLSWCDEQHKGMQIKNLNLHHLVYFRDHLVNYKRLKASTINVIIQALKKFFAFLHLKKIIKTNIASSLKSIKKTKGMKPKALTKNEVHALLSKAGFSTHGLGPRNYSIIKFLLNTGLRISELINLQYRDLTLNKELGEIRVVNSKGYKERTIQLNKNAKNTLSTYIKNNNLIPHPQTPIFADNNKRYKTQTIQKMISTVAKRANITRIKVSAHVLRHTFATHYLINHPGGLIELSTLLGHESINTTAIYTRMSSEHIRHTLEKLYKIDDTQI